LRVVHVDAVPLPDEAVPQYDRAWEVLLRPNPQEESKDDSEED
jgi:hypothetical protein